jgi:branched-chain amino acid transport system substrate-binding protein
MSPRLLRLWVRAGLLALVAGGLSGCGAEKAQPELRIGVITTASGPEATVENSGRATREAASLAADQANARGGVEVGGVTYRVALVFGDDQNVADQAVSAARKLIFQDSVVALIGPQLSANAIPVASVAEETRVPMISPMSTNAATTSGKQFVFRAGFTDDAQAGAIARFSRDEIKAGKAAILFDIASDYSRGMAAIFERQFTGAGGEVVVSASYTTGVTDFRSRLETIKGSGADVLFLPNYSADAIAQASQARELGLDIPIIGSDGWTASRVAPVPAFEGAFFTQHWHPDMDTPISRAFLADYRQAYGHEPLVTAALTYDSLNLVLAAIERENSIRPEDIQRGLAATTAFAGVSGTIGYTGTGDPQKNVVIVQIKGGQAKFYQQVQP